MKYKGKTALIYDNGLFVEWASLLAKDFSTVYYYTPWESSFPKSNSLLIGEGMPGVTRVKSIWEREVFDTTDLWIFPDIYSGELQQHLADDCGKRVWGSRSGEDLELNRPASKEFCRSIGIPIGPYEVVTGLDNLREYLAENPDQWVKISTTRGDMETFYSKNYKLIEPRLDALEQTLGAKKKIMQFTVEPSLEPAIETGYDGFCIDGKYPKSAMLGVEIKDKGYVVENRPYDELPDQVKLVNDKLSPWFEKAKYRGFWSTEIRVMNDDKGYLIDPCPRAGSPPNELYQMMISNWADILWEGADGVLVEPEFVANYGAELLIISEWADKNWLALEFPKGIKDNVKLRNCCYIDGKHYVAPQWTGYPEVGAIVAVGDSKEDAMKNCRALAEKVEGYYVSVFAECLDSATDALIELDELQDQEKVS
jgi:hypothetical protein